MRKLFIIGNGFDIAHRLNTRYSDFMTYLLQYETIPKEVYPGWIRLNDMSKDDQERHALYNKLIKYIPEEDLWKCFEAALASIDTEQLKEDNSCYLLGYGAENWSDSAHHDFQYMINEELNFTQHITDWFRKWIMSINTKVPSIPFISQIIKENDLFLNFNYTDTLETVYGVNENQIRYIHGKANRGDLLILGHHDESHFTQPVDKNKMTEEEYENYLEQMLSYDVRELEADEYIEEYFRRTFKDTKSIICTNHDFFENLCDIDEVFILGHSLSDIDMDYFVAIRNHVGSKCLWNISFHSQEDRVQAERFVRNLEIEDYNYISM